jgi:hypothetical protein
MSAPAVHCLQSRQPRPSAQRTAYVEGPAHPSFNPAVDVHLSAWLRHARHAPCEGEHATALALQWLRQGPPAVDLVASSHVAVDGVLAAWALLHPDSAQAHAQDLCDAASMATAWGYGGTMAQVLFLGVTLKLNTLTEQGADPTDVMVACVEEVTRLLGGLGRDEPRIREGQRALEQSLGLMRAGGVERRLPTERLATYVFPRAIHQDDWARALHVPSYGALITDRVLMWPHARAKVDRERVQLCSYEAAGGHIHDVWYPGYAWAHAAQLWRAPGIHAGTEDGYVVLDHPALAQVVEVLQGEERRGRDVDGAAQAVPVWADGQSGAQVSGGVVPAWTVMVCRRQAV